MVSEVVIQDDVRSIPMKPWRWQWVTDVRPLVEEKQRKKHQHKDPFIEVKKV